MPDRLRMTLHGKQVDLTDFARSHPGGERFLREFRDRDASEAFEGHRHSPEALRMVQRYVVAPALPPPGPSGSRCPP